MKHTVLITGALGGIGKALCKAFSEAEYFVIATDKQKKTKAHTNYLSLDLGKLAQDEELQNDFKAQVDRLLVANDLQLKAVINNAAVQILGTTETLSYDDWMTSLNVNLLAPFYLSKLFLKSLEDANGAIVNISSIHEKLTKPEFIAYATSKAALSSLTKSMALELSHKLRVNTICPAAIETEMLKAGFVGKEKEYQKLEDAHPSGRIGTPEEVANLALYLIDQAPAFLSGSCIELDGGISGRLHDPA